MNEGLPTKYPDVDAIVRSFTEGVISTLQGNLVGVYLTGSLSYEAFTYGSSDIDITVIVERPVSGIELESIQLLHSDLETKFEKWARRLECSYTPAEMLTSVMPPRAPRPWYWGDDGKLYASAPFGNEWIINNYHLYNYSIPLFGPSFRELAEPIDIEEVRKACVRDLLQEWVPKKSNQAWFKDSHHEAYFVVNLCRVLHTVICSLAGSKEMATTWAMEYCGERWRTLICIARRWHYGVELAIRGEALDFLDFVVREVSKTAVFAQIEAEIGLTRPPQVNDE